MPANRSRTLHWRRCLEQIHHRNGAIEIAVARDLEDEGAHLVWRVRVLGLSENELVVEPPVALGHTIPLDDGVHLVACIAVGQNRWMFATRLLGRVEARRPTGYCGPALRLELPATVKRCQRRDHFRVETAALNLPHVDAWPLLDPKSVVVAERMNELQIEPGSASDAIGSLGEDDVMPEVGPRFSARLLNVGGGGLGLDVAPEHHQVLSRHKLFWLRFPLPPELEFPICASTKLAHTHMQSNQHVYAGLAFDFTFNAGHQRFVAAQICRFIERLQHHQQLKRSA